MPAIRTSWPPTHSKDTPMLAPIISVTGVGASTARMMLSSLSPSEIMSAVVSENVQVVQSIKGIGLKTALTEFNISVIIPIILAIFLAVLLDFLLMLLPILRIMKPVIGIIAMA